MRSILSDQELARILALVESPGDLVTQILLQRNAARRSRLARCGEPIGFRRCTRVGGRQSYGITAKAKSASIPTSESNLGSDDPFGTVEQFRADGEGQALDAKMPGPWLHRQTCHERDSRIGQSGGLPEMANAAHELLQQGSAVRNAWRAQTLALDQYPPSLDSTVMWICGLAQLEAEVEIEMNVVLG